MTWFKSEHIENEATKIIDRTDEANTQYARIYGHGHGLVFINREHIDALLEGKGIAFYDGEYSHTVYLRINE